MDKRKFIIPIIILLLLGIAKLSFRKIIEPAASQPIAVAITTENITNNTVKPTLPVVKLAPERQNPLAGKTFYIDTSRDVNKLAAQYRAQNKEADAVLLDKIASQPGAIWLNGPHASDPTASYDINEVIRTSTEAKALGTTPLYELYAVPRRDACAAYSNGGFATNAAYLDWLQRILAALQTPTVFSVEADSVSQMADNKCFTPEQMSEREQLLTAAIAQLKANPNVIAVYLDSGQSDWFPDPKKLINTLKKSGIDHADGIAVNVSFFVATPEITKWSQQVIALLGGNKGAIIDTGRNGRGAPPANITGEARWCNPVGRGIGTIPTTATQQKNIDAYAWIKKAGESDGSCFGNPNAGVFMPATALEMARNASN